MYRHYHYPAGARLKLAQILVLPPHQGRGAGSMLLQAAQGLAEQTGACDLSVSWAGEAAQRGAARRSVRERCLQPQAGPCTVGGPMFCWHSDRSVMPLPHHPPPTARSSPLLPPPRPSWPCPQFEDPADALQALRTGLDVQRALALDWAQAAAAERISALAGDKGKSSAATANGSGSGSGKAARLAALEHPLAAPAEVLSRLRSELRLTRLQAGVVWRVLVYVVGKGEAAVVEGVKGMIRQQLVAQLAAAKEDAQGVLCVCARATGTQGVGCAACHPDAELAELLSVQFGVLKLCSPPGPAAAGKSVRETDKGFIMCRGAATTKSAIPLLPVEEQSAEQQADAVEESTEQQLEAVAAVAAKFLLLEDEEDEE